MLNNIDCMNIKPPFTKRDEGCRRVTEQTCPVRVFSGRQLDEPSCAAACRTACKSKLVERGCECADCRAGPSSCKGKDAPLAYLVRRGQMKLKICTRCKQDDDVVLGTLLNPKLDMFTFFAVYARYDCSGAAELINRAVQG